MTTETKRKDASGFRHAALLYPGETAFVDAVLPFIAGGRDAGEPVLVVVDAAKIDRLRTALGGNGSVEYQDMRAVGGNPARILPVWQDFVDRHPGGRGVGEPVWPERSPEELDECRIHEELLNVAFAGGPAWQLVCPYDTHTLGDDVLAAARSNHDAPGRRASTVVSRLPLAPPPTGTATHSFGVDGLAGVRRLVGEAAIGAGLTDAVEDLRLAVAEVAANSVAHGGGTGTLRVWTSSRSLICEVEDSGHISDPLAGRRHPATRAGSGRGLWLANQLCDLVQIRSGTRGTIIRLHLRLPA